MLSSRTDDVITLYLPSVHVTFQQHYLTLAMWPVGTSRKDASNRSRGPKATRNSSRRPLRRSAGEIIGFMEAKKTKGVRVFLRMFPPYALRFLYASMWSWVVFLHHFWSNMIFFQQTPVTSLFYLLERTHPTTDATVTLAACPDIWA